MKTRTAIYNIALALTLLLSFWSIVPTPFARADSDGPPETLDLVFVIDNSNSMSGVGDIPATDEHDLRIATARALIDVASTDFEASHVRVGVVTFGDQAVQQTDGLVYANAVGHARQVVKPARQGNTVISLAFRAAYQMLDEGGSYTGVHKSAVVFMTDGRPYDGRAETSADVERLFDDAQPWIDELAQAGTPVYIVAFNLSEQVSVQDQERWDAFANATGGKYYAVENIEDASEFFEDVIIDIIFKRRPDPVLEGQLIRPGEKISETFQVDAFLDRVTVAAVHTHEGNSYITARLFGPDGEGGEVEIHCNQQNWAAENLLCRGLESEDTDTVWTLIRPRPGTWRVEFEGGEGYIKAWKVPRAFGLVFIEPREDVLLSPGEPLELEIGLCETTREAKQACQENPKTARVGALDYKDEFLTSLEMNVTVQDPSGSQTRPVTMDYDPAQTRFTYLVTQQAEQGIYRVDAVLYYGKEIKQLGANSTTVYVGYLPTIDSLTIAEADDDEIEGLSALEPLELRALLASPDLALPGSLAMAGSTLTFPNGDQVYITPTVASGINNLFTASLGPFDEPGTYTVETRLTGRIQADENTVLDFGGRNQPQVTYAATFEVQPLQQPGLESATVLSRTITGQAIPVHVDVSLSRRVSQLPVVSAELYDNRKQGSAMLTTQDNPFPSGRIEYVGELRAPDKPGNYTVKVSLDGGNPQAFTVIVKYPLWVRISMWAAGLLLLAAICGIVYWYTSVRDLVPRVVIGTLKIERKVEGGGHEIVDEEVALSALNSKQIPLSRYVPEPEVTSVNARLVGRVKDRRHQVAPRLKMKQKTEHVTVNGIAGAEQLLSEGAVILTPNYRITYSLEGESRGASNVGSAPISPSAGGINV